LIDSKPLPTSGSTAKSAFGANSPKTVSKPCQNPSGDPRCVQTNALPRNRGGWCASWDKLR
jgi:hypothetical protein